MPKSMSKALEENSSLRRENKELRARIEVLEAQLSEMKSRNEVNSNGELHA